MNLKELQGCRLLVGFRYGKNHFVKIMTIFVTFLLKMTLCLCICFVFTKNPLSVFQIDILNFTMHILTILRCSLKTYVVRLHNLTSMNIFFTIDYKRSQVFFAILELLKGVKCLESNSDFMNKIKERSNTSIFKPNSTIRLGALFIINCSRHNHEKKSFR